MTKEKDTKLLVIIPAYNEEKTIQDVISKIPKQINGINKINCLVIDDGSTDNTAQIAKNCGAIVIKHHKNEGVGTVLSNGFKYALKNKYDIITNIDADNQFNPKEIKELITPIIEKKADFVVGNRFKNGKPKNMSTIKYWGNNLMSRLISNLIGENFQDVSCGFRAYNKKALLHLNLFGRFTYTQEMFLNLKFKNLNIKQIPIGVQYFKERQSKIAGNIFKYTWNTLNIIIRSFVYYKPLRFFGYPGIFFLIMGFFFFTFLIIHKIITKQYTPYKIFGFFGGALFVLGIILILFGLVADILDKIRRNQEEILYLEKRKNYYEE